MFDVLRTLPMEKTATPYNGPISAAGQRIRWDLFWLGEILQKDFYVTVNKFDAQSRFFSVVTNQGHPLQGYRFWRVLTVPGGDVVVETGAVDSNSGWVGWVKQALLQGNDEVMVTWEELMVNMLVQSGGRYVPETKYDDPHGSYTPERKQEFLDLVR